MTTHPQSTLPISAPRPLRADPGLGLIELLVALAIMAILTAAAAPSFSRMVAAQRIKSTSTDLYAALTRARSEAIKRNTDITLLPVTAGQWQDGWSIPNPSDSSLKIEDYAAVSSAVIIGPDSVIYSANGRIRGAAAPTFSISATGSDIQRCVSVDLSGRPALKPSAC